MKLSIIAAFLALIGATLLAPCEAREIYAPLRPATKVVSHNVVRSTNGDYEVVIDRSSKVPCLERKLAQLESEWQRLNRWSHTDHRARQRANALSVQIITLRGAIRAERADRVNADQWEKSQRVAEDANLSGQIVNETQARQDGDEDSTLLIVCLAGILLVGLAATALLTR